MPFIVEGKSESERLAEVAKRYELNIRDRYGKIPLPRMQHANLRLLQKSSFQVNCRKPRSLTTISFGNAQIAGKSTGKEHTGNKSAKHLKKRKRNWKN